MTQTGRAMANDDIVWKIAELQGELEEGALRISRFRRETTHLVGIAAHDLRHPVIAIRTDSELLPESPETRLSDDNRALATEVRRRADFMRELIDDVFEAASLDSIPFEWKAPNLERHVGQSVDNVRSLASRKKIQMEGAADADILAIRFDNERSRRRQGAQHRAMPRNPGASWSSTAAKPGSRAREEALSSSWLSRFGLTRAPAPRQHGRIDTIGPENTIPETCQSRLTGVSRLRRNVES